MQLAFSGGHVGLGVAGGCAVIRCRQTVANTAGQCLAAARSDRPNTLAWHSCAPALKLARSQAVPCRVRVVHGPPALNRHLFCWPSHEVLLVLRSSKLYSPATRQSTADPLQLSPRCAVTDQLRPDCPAQAPKCPCLLAGCYKSHRSFVSFIKKAESFLIFLCWAVQAVQYCD